MRRVRAVSAVRVRVLAVHSAHVRVLQGHGVVREVGAAEGSHGHLHGHLHGHAVCAHRGHRHQVSHVGGAQAVCTTRTKTRKTQQ